MNHGLINDKLYGRKGPRIGDEILESAKEYFAVYSGRQRYLVAMKHHTAQIAHKAGYSLNDICKILNIKNHASAFHLIHKYQKLSDHDQFIEEHYEDFIINKLYPMTPNPNNPENVKYIIKHEQFFKKTQQAQTEVASIKSFPTKVWPSF
jgi:hypothetical protein